MNQTKEDISMLHNVYQNASMGMQGTQLLIDKSEDSEFSKTLHRFLTDYTELQEQAASRLSEHGELPRSTGTMEHTALWMGVQFNTMIDKTSSHMAEMLIQGSTMGIVKGEKDLNTHEDVSPQVKKLTQRLIRIEKDNVQAMKQYLS